MKKLFFIFLYIVLNSAYGQNGEWPFPNGEWNGVINGSTGEYRRTNNTGTPRYHSGLDLTNGTDYAIHAINAGELVWNGDTRQCCSAIGIESDDDLLIRYIHVLPTQAIRNSIALGEAVMVNEGDHIADMIQVGSIHLHIEASNQNLLLAGFDDFQDNSFPYFDGTHINSTDFADGVAFYKQGLTATTNNHELMRMTNSTMIDDRNYLILYDKVDIVAHVIDPGLNSNGSANANYSLVPYEINFNLTDIQGITEILDWSLTFDTRPGTGGNGFGLNGFHPLSTHPHNPGIHIVTSHPSTAPNDRFLNTKLRIGEEENWITSDRRDSNLDVIFSLESRTPDGLYQINFNASDVENNENPKNEVREEQRPEIPVLIDNFKPFITRLEVWNSQFGDEYFEGQTGEWVWQNNQLDFVENLTSRTVPGEYVKIIITGSEPFFLADSDSDPNVQYEPMISLDGVTYRDFAISDDNLEVTFNLPPSVTASLDGAYTISIDAYDIGMNQITGFVPDDIFITSDELPHRTGNDNWSGTRPGQPDTKHFLRVGGSTCGAQRDAAGRLTEDPCPLIADFLFETVIGDYRRIKFTDNSSPLSDIDTWTWDYGDGASTSAPNGGTRHHSFSSDGDYLVSLTVSRGDENNTYQTTVSVTSDIRANFIASTENGPASLNVDFNSSASTGVITQRTWSINPSHGFTYTSGDEHSTSPSIRFDQAGLYFVTLEVTDGIFTHSSTSEITAYGSEPIANFYWNEPIIAGTFPTSFTSSSYYDCDGLPTESWSFGDTNPPTTATGSGYSHLFQSGGTFPVTLCVTDACGQENCLTKQVEVGEYVPSVIPLFNGPVTIERGSEVIFADLSSPIENIDRWIWHFELETSHGVAPPSTPGDLNYTSFQPTVSHPFNTLGTYKVRLSTHDQKPQQIQFPAYHEVIVTVIPETPYDEEEFFLEETDEDYLDVAVNRDLVIILSQSDDAEKRLQFYQRTSSGWGLQRHRGSSTFNRLNDLHTIDSNGGYIAGLSKNNGKNYLAIYGGLYDNFYLARLYNLSSWGIPDGSQIFEPKILADRIVVPALLDEVSNDYRLYILEKNNLNWNSSPTEIISFEFHEDYDDNYLGEPFIVELSDNAIATKTEGVVWVSEKQEEEWVSRIIYTPRELRDSETNELKIYKPMDIGFSEEVLAIGAVTDDIEKEGIIEAYTRSPNGWQDDIDLTIILAGSESRNGPDAISGLGWQVEVQNDKVFAHAPRDPNSKNPLFQGKQSLMYRYEQVSTPSIIRTDYSRIVPEQNQFHEPFDEESFTMESHQGTIAALNKNGKLWIFENGDCVAIHDINSLTVARNENQGFSGRVIDIGGVNNVANDGSLDLNPSERLHINSIFHAQRGSRVHIKGEPCTE